MVMRPLSAEPVLGSHVVSVLVVGEGPRDLALVWVVVQATSATVMEKADRRYPSVPVPSWPGVKTFSAATSVTKSLPTSTFMSEMSF